MPIVHWDDTLGHFILYSSNSENHFLKVSVSFSAVLQVVSINNPELNDTKCYLLHNRLLPHAYDIHYDLLRPRCVQLFIVRECI